MTSYCATPVVHQSGGPPKASRNSGYWRTRARNSDWWPSGADCDALLLVADDGCESLGIIRVLAAGYCFRVRWPQVGSKWAVVAASCS